MGTLSAPSARLSRAIISVIFGGNPKAIAAYEELTRQVVDVLPDAVDSNAVAADDAQFDASNALALGAALQNPSYIVAATSTALNNERVLSGGTGVTVTFGAGTATITVNVLTILGYTPANKAGDTFSGPIILPSYTVAGLPVGTLGAKAFVTDATAPTFLGALTGGGAVKTPVFHNGAAWVAG